jgi:hypothetical protein
MIEIEVSVGGKLYSRLDTAFKELGDRLEKSIDGASVLLGKELKTALDLVYKRMVEQHGRSWGGGVVNTSDRLQSRTGQGLRSIAESIEVRGSKAALEGIISAGMMAIHETGGTIRATRSQYLTIPLPSALDARGVPLRQRAREWDNTFVARSRAGSLLIFRKLPGPNQITPLYILKPSVTIKPRLGMERSIVGDALPYFERKAFEIIARALENA